ncbi:MAG: hypothetical protein D6729_12740 [Deltaproteobacteria bacterium]|nr:MAG: hypothetical protein D6729_12740 [Deltaproteobacteria bacterium]
MGRGGWALTAVVLAAAMAPQALWAARLVEPFTFVDSIAEGEITLRFVVEGPLAGPVTVGYLERGRVRESTEVDAELPAGAFGTYTVTLRVRGKVSGKHRFAFQDGAGKRFGVFEAHIVRGPDQETFLGSRREVVRTWMEDGRRHLKEAWVDDTGEHLAVEFYLKVDEPQAPVEVIFKHRGKTVCRDDLVLSGAKGQVLRLRAHCIRASAPPQKAEGDVALDDTGYMEHELAADGLDIDADAKLLENALTVKEVRKMEGAWEVIVRGGKRGQVRRRIGFRVAHGRIASQGKGRFPFKRAKVKVIVP